MTDIFWADVSYFQPPVNDSYPYPVLSIRSNDGTFRDPAFAGNYAWMRRNLDSGKLAVGIVYCYVRPNWLDTANTMRDMINRNGGLHPKVVLMLDVESGGNPGGDGSDWINRCYWNLVDFCGGNTKRVIGYANAGDFNSMWRTRPAGLRVIGAGYGQNPNLPGQIGHQYTDGVYGAGQGLPMGAAPFGNCDMNTSPMSAAEFANQTGVGAPPVNLINQAAQQAAAWIGARIDQNEQPCRDGVGRYVTYQNATVYWDGHTSAAYVVPRGGLFEAYGAYDYEMGPLGYPVHDFTRLPGGGVQAFAGGVLYVANGETTGFYVHGKIGDAYAAQGYETGRLGWVTSNELPVPDTDNIVQHFTGGDLKWSPSGVITEFH